jgi:hypothetical protein
MNGVITNIMNPLGDHRWPVDPTQALIVNENVSSASSVTTQMTDGSKVRVRVSVRVRVRFKLTEFRIMANPNPNPNSNPNP